MVVDYRRRSLVGSWDAYDNLRAMFFENRFLCFFGGTTIKWKKPTSPRIISKQVGYSTGQARHSGGLWRQIVTRRVGGGTNVKAAGSDLVQNKANAFRSTKSWKRALVTDVADCALKPRQSAIEHKGWQQCRYKCEGGGGSFNFSRSIERVN